MTIIASLLLLSTIERVSQIAYNKYEIQTDGAGGAIQLLDNDDHNVTDWVTLPASCAAACTNTAGCSDNCRIEITDETHFKNVHAAVQMSSAPTATDGNTLVLNNISATWQLLHEQATACCRIQVAGSTDAASDYVKYTPSMTMNADKTELTVTAGAYAPQLLYVQSSTGLILLSDNEYIHAGRTLGASYSRTVALPPGLTNVTLQACAAITDVDEACTTLSVDADGAIEYLSPSPPSPPSPPPAPPSPPPPPPSPPSAPSPPSPPPMPASPPHPPFTTLADLMPPPAAPPTSNATAVIGGVVGGLVGLLLLLGIGFGVFCYQKKRGGKYGIGKQATAEVEVPKV